jgi:hypothetical protein
MVIATVGMRMDPTIHPVLRKIIGTHIMPISKVDF